jgi:hypothetical protein
MNPTCEWEISNERDSGIGTEQKKIDGDDWKRLATTIPQVPNDENNTPIGDEGKNLIEKLTKRLSVESEVDSIDSLIGAYESFIRMRDLH